MSELYLLVLADSHHLAEAILYFFFWFGDHNTNCRLYGPIPHRIGERKRSIIEEIELQLESTIIVLVNLGPTTQTKIDSPILSKFVKNPNNKIVDTYFL